MIGLTIIAAILFSVNVTMGTIEAQQQEGEQQVKSDGGLTATLNGNSFRIGDTIIVSGTVQQRDVNSSVSISVVDPQSRYVERASAPVSANNEFTHSFVAGVEEETGLLSLFDIDEPMVTSGNYRMIVSYSPPGADRQQEVEFIFEYNSASTAAELQTVGPTITFQNNTEGFRVQVPNGWVVDDRFNGTDRSAEQVVRQHGGKYLAAMCPQNQALPAIGGLHSCQLTSPTGIGVVMLSFTDLQMRPDFAVLARENKSITTSDLVAIYIELFRDLLASPPYIEIVNNTDIAVNVIDSQTNQTIGTAPAKFVEFIETSSDGTSNKDFVLVALSNDTNTGYVVRPLIQGGWESTKEAPPFIRVVLDSFGLMTTRSPPTMPSPPSSTATTIPTSPLLPQQSQQQQQSLHWQ